MALACLSVGWAGAQHDLSLFRLQSDKYVSRGDLVQVTYVVTNDLGTDVDGIAVALTIPTGLDYLQHSPNRTFDPGTGVWTVGSLSYRQVQTTITIDFRVTGEGVINFPAEIVAMSTADVDSAPANGDVDEDDYIGTCFSVPIRAECGQSVRLEAPAGAPGYQWYLDGLPIAGATAQVLDVGESGSYYFEFDGAPSSCARGTCCDAIVSFDSISVALSQPSVCTGGFDTVRFDLPDVDEANFEQAYTWSSPDDPMLELLSCTACAEPALVVGADYLGDSLRYAVSVVTTARLSGREVCNANATLVIEVLQAPQLQFITPVYACAGGCYDLEVTSDLPTTSVTWEGPNLRSPDGNVMEYCPREVDGYTSELFVVTAVGVDGCKRVDSVSVITVPAVDVQLVAMAPVCQSEAAELSAFTIPALPADSLVVAWSEAPGNPGAGGNLTVADELTVTTGPLAPGDYAFDLSVSRVAPDGSLHCAFDTTQTFTVQDDCAQPRLGGFAWRDADPNGLRQNFEAPFPGLTVRLLDAAGVATGLTTVTDASGFYEFASLAVADYRVEFESRPGFAFAPQNVGADEFVDSDPNAAGVTDAFATTYDETVHSVSAGYAADCQLAFANVTATPSDCGNAAGALSFDVTGSFGNDLRYTWAPAVSTGRSATGLSPGDYQVTVFDDYNDCALTETLTVPGPRNFTLTASSTPTACPGGSGGSITVDTDGGTPPFTVEYTGAANGAEMAATMPYTVRDLTGGEYVVTVTDATNCRQRDRVVVDENDPLITLEVVAFTPAGCNGARDGSFEVEVLGFDQAYDLLVDGLTVVTGETGTRINVPGQAAGLRSIEVTDVNGCTQTLDFPLEGGEQLIDLATIDVTPVDCHGAATGALASDEGTAYEVYDSRGQRVGTLPLANLTADRYTLRDRRNLNCETNETVLLTQPDRLSLTVAAQGEDCDASDGRIVATLEGGARPYAYEWEGGLSADSTYAGLTAGEYRLRVFDANDCVIDTTVVVPNLCEPLVCAPYFTADTLVLESDAPTLDWCMANFDLPTGRSFALDGEDLSTDRCTRSGLVYFNLASLPGDGADGPYLIEFWYGGDDVVLAEQVADAPALAEALDRADAWGRWTYDAEENTVRGGQPERPYGEVEVTHVASGRTVYLTPRTLNNQLSTSVSLGVPGGYAVTTLNPATGCRDSVYVVTRRPDACEDVYVATSVQRATPYCDEVAPVCLDLPFALLADYTLAFDGAEYTGPTEACATDEVVHYDITGVNFAGQVIVERWTVDGRVESARVASPAELAARMRAFDGEAWRYDLALGKVRGGNAERDYRDLRLRDAAGVVTSLSPARGIEDGTAVELPTGTRLATLTRRDGCVSEFTVTLTCSAATPPTVDTVRWTLGVGFADTLCISTAELPGELARVENVCRGASGEFALVDVTAGTCLAGEGMEVGTEEFCLLACDLAGVCDTTIVLIDVLSAEEYIFPEANPDRDSLEFNGSTLIDVLVNDELRGTFGSLEVVNYPRYGQATVVDGAIEYVADQQFCGIDNFVYELCNTRGCDTANVELYVECTDLIIYSGFSPNFDDINETFTVLGVEQFPDNRMEVYNRWGNKVFEADNYDNSWRGTTVDGDELLQGTYFYIFQDGRGRTYTGYVYIKR